jgi:hypothetical protein
MFTSILYKFRATQCSSSGESNVSVQLLVYVTLCKWPCGMRVSPDLHTTRSLTQSDIYQTLYWYNWFSWWWALGCSKHVEDWNKHIRKKELCVRLVIYQNYTEMQHGQQNIKFVLLFEQHPFCIAIHPPFPPSHSNARLSTIATQLRWFITE